jgi:NAD(P)H-flavin reductase
MEQGSEQRRFITLPLKTIQPWERDIFELQFSWPGPLSEAGQFFMLRPQRSSVFLGRPISVLDHRGETLRFLVARRGRGTAELTELRAGDSVELSGPLGNSWPREVQKEDRDPVALIGGGIGIAPLLFLARTLKPKTFDFYAGFRSQPYGMDGVDASRVVIASEKGLGGSRGTIAQFFDPRPYGGVYACGPEALLKVVAELCHRSSVPCYVSMERRMACGVGACLGCTVRTMGGNRRCCVDGPIFSAQEVLFGNP